MTTGMRMFAGVPVGRAVTTESNAAFLAGSQVNPVAPDFYALFAFKPRCWSNARDGVNVRTSFSRHGCVHNPTRAGPDEQKQSR
jgi:hypothetical protein